MPGASGGVQSRQEHGGDGPPKKITRSNANTESTAANANLMPLSANLKDFETFAGNTLTKETPSVSLQTEEMKIDDLVEMEDDPLVYTSMNMPSEYDDDHKGPYVVYVDTLKTEPRTPINQFRLTKKLIDMKINDVNNVLKVGYSRCKVFFKTHTAANEFAKNKQLEAAGYTPKIFTHLLTKTGIVFNIPEEITMTELYYMLSSPVPVVKLNRMTRKGNNEREATMKVKVVFKGLQIPKEMDFAYTKLTTKPFIPFGQCYNCYRFNHMAEHCKQKEKTCEKCYSNHGTESQCDTSMIMCTNCKDNHPPTDRKCPAREKALNLKRLMVLENLSLKEARAKYAGIIGGNRFEILGEETVDGTFPQLPTNPDKFIDNSKEAARHMHKMQSYAKVTKITKPNINRQREMDNAKRNMNEWRQATKDCNTASEGRRDMANPHSVSDVEKMASQLKSIANSFFSRWGDATLTQNDRKFLGEMAKAVDRVLIMKDRDEIVAPTRGVTNNTNYQD